jgi:dTDP-4-amino-4,6-dideoxy-D-glucose transaminase
MTPIYVARPIVPDLTEYTELLAIAFKNRRLTNGAALVSTLQLRLAEILRAPHVALLSNGTVAIEIAARALGMSGKVITTPFTFPATLSALLWIGLEPVLVDIEDEFLTIDPDRIEESITKDVSGIVGVHVYGNPCDLQRINSIARKRGIPVLYDGAHVFDATHDGEAIVNAGDATTLSFHATKYFNTAEGGAIVSSSPATAERVANLRNFGIKAEDQIVDVGINGKMSELNAALGLANLSSLHAEKMQRQSVIDTYNDVLQGQDGLRVLSTRPGTSERFQYYTIRIPGDGKQSRRDRVYNSLREKGIFARRYFWPLLSDVPALRSRLSQSSFSFPVAERAAAEVLVLPLHGGVSIDDAARIGNEIIGELKG